MKADLTAHSLLLLLVFPVSCSTEMSGEKESQPYTALCSYLLPNFPDAMDCMPSNCDNVHPFPWCCFGQIFCLNENNTNMGHKLTSSQVGHRCWGGTMAKFKLKPWSLETLQCSCLWGLLHCYGKILDLTNKHWHLWSFSHAAIWDLVTPNHLGNWLWCHSFPETQVKRQDEGGNEKTEKAIEICLKMYKE